MTIRLYLKDEEDCGRFEWGSVIFYRVYVVLRKTNVFK